MQGNMKDYNDHDTKELAPLKPGDTVMVQSYDLDWSLGIIASSTKDPRSYMVQTTEGTCYRRNKRLSAKCQTKVCV